jgi:large subunit ribosomal protein L10
MVKEEKIKAVDELANLLNKYSVIGILNLCKTPASALQKIKMNLKDKALIKVAKKTIILFALEKTKKETLKEFLVGYPALILSNEDPFKLYLMIQRQRVPSSAKPGDIPKEDIEVKAGPTDLMPGPAISTLTKVKIPAKVEAGKIAVMRDKVVCKAGEKVSLDLASALQLLKLEPMEVRLNVVVFEEKGIVYKAEQLFVDEEKLLNDIQLAIQNAFNLSINSGYPTKQSIEFMIAKAYWNAKQLESEIGTEKTEVKEEVKADEESSERPEEKEQKETKNGGVKNGNDI